MAWPSCKLRIPHYVRQYPSSSQDQRPHVWPVVQRQRPGARRGQWYEGAWGREGSCQSQVRSGARRSDASLSRRTTLLPRVGARNRHFMAEREAHSERGCNRKIAVVISCKVNCVNIPIIFRGGNLSWLTQRTAGNEGTIRTCHDRG